MRQLSAIAIVMLIAAPLPAFAYTQADADACTPDAMKYCMQAIPDEGRVAHCLVENKPQLSLACAAVFGRAHAASNERPARAQKTKF